MSAATLGAFDLGDVTARAIRTFRSSPAFELTLLVRGTPVAVVSNDGRGGCHDWQPVRGGDFRQMRDMQAALNKLAHGACSGTSLSEAADVIASCLADKAKDGNEAARWWNEAMAADVANDAAGDYVVVR